jgi:hypothetical protein
MTSEKKNVSCKNAVFLAMTVVCGFLTEEFSWNTKLWEMEGRCWWNNLLLECLVLISITLLIQKIVPACMTFLTINFIYGLINHYVIAFRGNPPLIGDFLAAGTAVKVMKNYDYTIDGSVLKALCVLVLYFVVCKYLVPAEPGFIKGFRWILEKAWKRIPDSGIVRELMFRAVGMVLVVCLWWGTVSLAFVKKQGFQINGWSPAQSFRSYGAPLALLASYYNLRMEEPEGYSADEVREQLADYDGKGEENASEADSEAQASKLPTVIVIMNESFSDLSALGELETGEYLTNYKNLASYVMKGTAYVSVVGGGTSNSEFEFLTGSSMAFIGSGIYPYTSYDLTKGMSLPEIMKEHGYRTVAMHPAAATNWSRDKAYPQLGFDSFLSIDDAPDSGWAYVRSYVSDASDYEKVREIYEQSKEDGQPLFLFNVTIQNHGGYTGEFAEGLEPVSIEEAYQSYEDVTNYLALIRNSDEAMGDLLEYFSEQEDPVVICFFGDHEPGLNSEFWSLVRNIQGEETAEERQDLHQTPYFIWTNYSTGVQQVQKNLSLNYLASNLLEVLGIETTYTNYLLDLEKTIPIVNTEGYQTGDGKWHYLSEENEQVEQYQKVQYYELSQKR